VCTQGLAIRNANEVQFFCGAIELSGSEQRWGFIARSDLPIIA